MSPYLHMMRRVKIMVMMVVVVMMMRRRGGGGGEGVLLPSGYPTT